MNDRQHAASCRLRQRCRGTRILLVWQQFPFLDLKTCVEYAKCVISRCVIAALRYKEGKVISWNTRWRYDSVKPEMASESDPHSFQDQHLCWSHRAFVGSFHVSAPLRRDFEYAGPEHGVGAIIACIISKLQLEHLISSSKPPRQNIRRTVTSGSNGRPSLFLHSCSTPTLCLRAGPIYYTNS